MKKTLFLAALAAFVALLFAALATSTVGSVPALNLRLVDWVICPAGQQLEYRELGPITYTDSTGTHNQERISISCLASDGTRVEGKSSATIAALMVLYSLACFAPLFGAGLLLRYRLRRRRLAQTGQALQR
jgi:hypothetical protein